MTGLRGIQGELATLFAPQVEQLGMRLERSGGLWLGRARGGVARGEMWLCSPLPNCLVLVHDVTPLGDMRLLEESSGPYLCACSLFDDARACSRSCGLPLRSLGGERPGPDAPGRRAAGASAQELATFFERAARAHESDLGRLTARGRSSSSPASSTSSSGGTRESSTGSPTSLTARGKGRCAQWSGAPWAQSPTVRAAGPGRSSSSPPSSTPSPPASRRAAARSGRTTPTRISRARRRGPSSRLSSRESGHPAPASSQGGST